MPCAGWGAGLLPLSPLPGSCPGRASAQGSLPEPQEPPEPSGLSSASAEEAPGRAGVRTAASRMWCVGGGSQSISISRNTMPTAWAGASAAAGPATQPNSSTLSPPPAAAAGCRQIQPERALRRVPRGSRYRLQAALQAPRPAPHGSLRGFFLVPCHKRISGLPPAPVLHGGGCCAAVCLLASARSQPSSSTSLTTSTREILRSADFTSQRER